MPTKIKILLFTMIAGSGLIIFSVFANVKNISNLGANIGQIISEGNSDPAAKKNNLNAKSIEKSDIDKDGLFDEEEPLYRTDPLNSDTDADGFLDGEEVAAGCSPIVSGPNDCGSGQKSSQLPQNITEYFGNLIFGGLLSNDLKKDNPDSSNYLSLLIDEALNTKTLLLSVDGSVLDKSSDDNYSSPQKYLNELENILKKYFFTKKSLKNLGTVDFRDFDFSPYVNDLNRLHEELSKTNPPQDWASTHEKLADFILKLKTYFSNLNEQQEDPLRTLITISHTELLLEDYEGLVKEIKQKIKEQNLKSDIF